MIQTALIQFGDSSSGIAALGVDPKALVIQLITFVLAYMVLKKWAFGPIIKAMNERRATIENGVRLGEKMQKEQAALEAEVAKTLAAARSQADSIIAGAQEEARASLREAEDKARTKADGIISEAEERIRQETARARHKLEKELVGLISEVTEAIIDEKVDSVKDAALIDKALRGRVNA